MLQSLSDLSVRAKLMFAGALSLLLIVTLAGAGWIGYQRLTQGNQINRLADEQSLSLQIILRALNELIVAEGSSEPSRQMATKGLAGFSAAFAEIEKAVAGPETMPALASLRDKWTVFEVDVRKFNSVRVLRNDDDAVMLVFGNLVKKAGTVDKDVQAIAEIVHRHTAEMIRSTLLAVATLTAFLATLLFALYVWLYRQITLPIRDMQSTMSSIHRDKDLSRRTTAAGKSEIGQASQAFNALMASFQTVIRDVRNSVEGLGQSATGVSNASRLVKQYAEQQNQAVTVAENAVSTIRESVDDIRSRVGEAMEIAQRSSVLADQGSKVVQDAGNSMRQMSETVRGAAQQVSGLSGQSEQIGNIVGTIRDIAGQTNLLALNAAIEAARAGEQGRGFAVVADEVRRLAERTSGATNDISRLVGAIQAEILQTIASMDQTVAQVGEVVVLANDASASIAEINVGARQTAQVVSGIADATQKHASAGDEISASVAEISRLANENMQTAGKTAASAGHMEELASNFSRMVEAYKT